MAYKAVRGGREKFEWEKEFIGTVRTKMDIFNLKMEDVAKVLGICEDAFSLKLNDPRKFKLWEFIKLLDFLHIDRAEMVQKLFKGENRK